MPRDLNDFFSVYSISSPTNEQEDRRKQLLAAKDRILYAWTKDGLRAAVGLKYSANDQNPAQRKCEFEFEVKFVLTTKPDGVVEWIELNRSGSCLAICCQRRLYVVFLPKSLWLLRSLNEIEPSYLSRCIEIDHQRSKKNKSLKCLRLRWHPGSLIDRHLVTLWTDDVIRIYNVAQPAAGPEEIDLKPDSDLVSPKSRLMLSTLGEVAVSFDFGSLLELADDHSEHELWPIFVLFGNGDVYSVISNIKENKHLPPMGPLLMSPSTDDNYGTDSCDILFVHGKLSVLVIATSYGILYHAVVSEDKNNQDSKNFAFQLHVYESVELEFSLSTVDLATRDVKEDNDSSNIVLQRDPLIPRRYFAYHRAGLHSIELPWVQDLEDESMATLSDAASNVEYALCTAPKRNANMNENCAIGLAAVSSLCTDSAIVVLLSDFSIYCLPLSYDAISSLTTAATTSQLVEAKNPNRDYFIDTIKRVLQKNANVPVLRARGEKTISEQEAAELMCRCTEVLRKEYVERLLAAKEACKKRVAELNTVFAQHNQDLNRLEQLAKDSMDRANRSGERLMELTSKEQILHKRLEKLADAVSGGVAGELSADEEKMCKEMREMLDNVANMADEVNQMKDKVDLVPDNAMNPRGISSPTSLNVVELKKRLEEHQHQIESLVVSMKKLEKEMN